MRPFFALRKKPLHTGVRTGCHYLIGLRVCQCVCNIRRFYRLRELYEADFHQPGIDESGTVWANACNVFPRMPSRVGRGRRAAVDFVVCFGWGGRIFQFFFFLRFFSFFERTRPAATMRPHLTSFSYLLVPGCVRGAIT